MKGLLVRSGHEHHSSSPSTGEMPCHALQRTRPVRSGCNPRVPWAGSLGRSARGRVHVIADERLISDRFPRASGYHPEWVLAGVSGGANPLWLTEWLTESLDLRPGMRVLDLGCGRAMSSVFLRREFDVQVWATDLWFSASENIQRVRDAGVEDGVFPVHADARSLPFAEGFFDAVVSIDSFMYYGTDDMYLNYLARFVKPGGPVGIALAGLIDSARRSGSRAPWRVVGRGAAILPALGGLVVSALGPDRHPGRRPGRHSSGWLGIVEGLANR